MGIERRWRYWPGVVACAAVVVAAVACSEPVSMMVVTTFGPVALMALVLPMLGIGRSRKSDGSDRRP